jgi:hypothetical protein
MPRFTRHLFTLCSAVSLLLCMATAVLWVKSYERTVGLKRESFDLSDPAAWAAHTVVAGSLQGAFQLEVSQLCVTQPSERVAALRQTYADPHWSTLSFPPKAPAEGWAWYRPNWLHKNTTQPGRAWSRTE